MKKQIALGVLAQKPWPFTRVIAYFLEQLDQTSKGILFSYNPATGGRKVNLWSTNHYMASIPGSELCSSKGTEQLSPGGSWLKFKLCLQTARGYHTNLSQAKLFFHPATHRNGTPGAGLYRNHRHNLFGSAQTRKWVSPQILNRRNGSQRAVLWERGKGCQDTQ